MRNQRLRCTFWKYLWASFSLYHVFQASCLIFWSCFLASVSSFASCLSARLIARSAFSQLFSSLSILICLIPSNSTQPPLCATVLGCDLRLALSICVLLLLRSSSVIWHNWYAAATLPFMNWRIGVIKPLSSPFLLMLFSSIQPWLIRSLAVHEVRWIRGISIDGGVIGRVFLRWYSDSKSSTQRGWYGIKPVACQADRIVEILNVFIQICWNKARKSALFRVGSVCYTNLSRAS